ncbi:MAG: archease [Micrococcales bacterium]|nr:archease [Micrococcales bacterium]
MSATVMWLGRPPPGARPSAQERWYRSGPPTPSAGHLVVPDGLVVHVVAWAPTREHCVAETVAAVVESFARIGRCAPAHFHRSIVPGEDDTELLHNVLDEVLFDIGSTGIVPVWIRLQTRSAGTELEIGGVDLSTLQDPGHLPDGVTSEHLGHGRAVEWSADVILGPVDGDRGPSPDLDAVAAPSPADRPEPAAGRP